MARISVECPFFNGTTEALCMEDTLYDLVIGNIDGSKLPDMSHFAASVVTRSRAKKDKRTYKKLKVPDQIINSDRNAIELDQASDPKLSIYTEVSRVRQRDRESGHTPRRNKVHNEERVNLSAVYFAW